MAYRKLYVGDLVRIVDIKSGFHGANAVVIRADEIYSRVQINVGRTDRLESRCIDVPNENLLVRHSDYYFINDGRVDHDSKAQYENKRKEEFYNRNVDEERECAYDGWDREDLIERLIELERELDEIKGNS